MLILNVILWLATLRERIDRKRQSRRLASSRLRTEQLREEAKQRQIVGLLTFPWVGERSVHRGSGGHRPLSESMASAIRASGLWKPNARRVIIRICVLIASTRAFERPCSIAATIPARCLVMVLASLTNGARRQRRAHAIHSSSSAIAASAGNR
jgi:hypothetical protein